MQSIVTYMRIDSMQEQLLDTFARKAGTSRIFCSTISCRSTEVRAIRNKRKFVPSRTTRTRFNK